jgi:hypothetical protein
MVQTCTVRQVLAAAGPPARAKERVEGGELSSSSLSLLLLLLPPLLVVEPETYAFFLPFPLPLEMRLFSVSVIRVVFGGGGA